MTLPALSFTIDGLPVELVGFSANATAYGGCDQARGTMTEETARRIPNTVSQGSTLEVRTDANFLVWKGRLSAKPAIRGGLASFAAQGEQVRLRKRAVRRLFQSRDYSMWSDEAGNPHNYTGDKPEKFDLTVDNGVLFAHKNGVALAANDARGVALWAPGNTFTRYAFSWASTFADTTWKLRVNRAAGPSGAGTLVADHGISATSGTVDQAVTSGQDQLTLVHIWTGGAVTAGAHYVLVTNLRVNGIASGDTYRADEVMTYLGGVHGFDTTKVFSTGANILPLDWSSGSDGDLADYVSSISDYYWRVYEGLEFQRWGAKEWTVYRSGARVDLTPLEIFNQVVVRYQDVGGAPREVTQTSSPDPLAVHGITNTFEESLSDVQPNADLANSVASTLLARYSTQRYSGRIDAVEVFGADGRDAPFEVRPGDTIRIADWEPGESLTVRVHEVEVTPQGVSFGIEAPVSVASLLAGASGSAARAPSTAGLPEPEAAEAAEVEPGTGHSHHRKKHRHVKKGGHKHHGKRHKHA